MQHDNDDGYGQFTGHYEGSSVILLQVHIVMVRPGTHLTCEKSWVPVQNQSVPVKKKKNESKIENAWSIM